MASIETTELKLKTTPTGGEEPHESAYYRRLLSAGYKGFLQGSVGGGALYGAFGLVIGGLIAIAAAPAIGVFAFALIPAAAAAGILKGASTFGNIGSVAAINAENSDLSEQRRYLLDRYYDLPEGPEGDREAAAIKKELLARQRDNEVAPSFFHWKTVAIGAVIGAVVGLAAFSPFGLGFLATGALEHLATNLGLSALLASPATLTAGGVALGTLSGTLAGATIGIDRYYIRKWFDHTQGVVHSSGHTENVLNERTHQIQRLKTAALEDQKTKQHIQDVALGLVPNTSQGTAIVGEAQSIADLKPSADVAAPAAEKPQPATKISAARRDGLLEIQKALEISPA